jgi:hypothetical protein
VAFTDEIVVLLGKGDLTFEPAKIKGPAAGNPQETVLRDFNGDGKLDVLQVDNTSSVWLALGVGDGTVGTPTSIGPAAYPTTGAIGDFDGDGDLDVAAGDSILRNNGSGSFTRTAFGGVGYGLMRTGDLDGDGKLDLLGSEGDTRLKFHKGNGDATFVAAGTTITGPNNISKFYVLDVDGNGKLDVVATRADGFENGVLYCGNGDGTFATPKLLPTSGSRNFAFADLNGDGKLDLLLGSTGAGINTYLAD